MTSVVMNFASNLKNEAMQPKHLLYDVAVGAVGTFVIDAVGIDDAIGNAVGMLNLGGERSGQVASGVTYATIGLLQRSTMAALR